MLGMNMINMRETGGFSPGPLSPITSVCVGPESSVTTGNLRDARQKDKVHAGGELKKQSKIKRDGWDWAQVGNAMRCGAM